MAIHTFEYTASRLDPSPAFPEGIVVKRPLLNVALINGGAKFSCFAAVDSMAEYTMFPKAFMSEIGLDEQAGEDGNVHGVGGPIDSNFQYVTIEIGEGIQFHAYVAFSSSLDSMGFGMLGRNGFFEHVKSVSFYPDFFGFET